MPSHIMYNNINPSSTTFFPQGSTIRVNGSLLDDMLLTSSAPATANSTNIGHYDSLFYNLSLLRDKVEQVESMVGIIVSPDPVQRGNFSGAVAGATAIAQDIVVVASSMIFAFQKMASGESNRNDLMDNFVQASCSGGDRGLYDGQALSYNVQRYEPCKPSKIPLPPESNKIKQHTDAITTTITTRNDVIELDPADLLAKYTHYCHICGKGFKRDANLRMHMRAHGDQYKTNAALANPSKQTTNSDSQTSKYSCPHEGCRWNKNHVKFQPLKSMVCVKNHYKRSHCPKMYICNRCNRKQFSVLSDLRTHEKHCGDLRWRCSCGTSFSRKDKLMGHVALFVGHDPVDLRLKDKP